MTRYPKVSQQNIPRNLATMLFLMVLGTTYKYLIALINGHLFNILPDMEISIYF